MKSKPQYKNIIGPTIRACRRERGWTQETLATALCGVGYPATRAGVSKVEARLVRVRDYHVLYFAAALRVDAQDLLRRLNRNLPTDPANLLSGRP
jgi:transcriptional regulator with XRE-family HTH domain